jgi:uncharacterized protein (TIGR02453 family)
MATSASNPFGPGLLRFLRDLERNNTRTWFEENKARYERDVREPALAFVRAMAPVLKGVSGQLRAVDRKVGGSLLRIHRDVRFSKDKRPFKTNLGIQFRHARGKDIHAPGLYVHVDPSTAFLGAGMWRPDAASLAAVRRAIHADGRGWVRARDDRRFREHWDLDGDSVKTAPRGYPRDHPLIEDLRRTDHLAVCRLGHRDVTREDLLDLLADRFAKARPYLAFQARALKLPF